MKRKMCTLRPGGILCFLCFLWLIEYMDRKKSHHEDTKSTKGRRGIYPRIASFLNPVWLFPL